MQQPRARSAQLVPEDRTRRMPKTKLRGEKISEACVSRKILVTAEADCNSQVKYVRKTIKHMTRKIRGTVKAKKKVEESVLEFD